MRQREREGEGGSTQGPHLGNPYHSVEDISLLALS